MIQTCRPVSRFKVVMIIFNYFFIVMGKILYELMGLFCCSTLSGH